MTPDDSTKIDWQRLLTVTLLPEPMFRIDDDWSDARREFVVPTRDAPKPRRGIALDGEI